MNETALLQNYLMVGAMLFGIGMVGFLVRRNLIVIFLCAEMMLQGISLSLIAWSRYHDNWDGQLLTVFIITIAACEAGIALVLVLMLCQRAGNLDIAHWQSTREEGLPPLVDREVPEEPTEPVQSWPSLTPAGVEPELKPAEHIFRSHV